MASRRNMQLKVDCEPWLVSVLKSQKANFSQHLHEVLPLSEARVKVPAGSGWSQTQGIKHRNLIPYL
jgi:hypothetical protein